MRGTLLQYYLEDVWYGVAVLSARHVVPVLLLLLRLVRNVRY